MYLVRDNIQRNLFLCVFSVLVEWVWRKLRGYSRLVDNLSPSLSEISNSKQTINNCRYREEGVRVRDKDDIGTRTGYPHPSRVASWPGDVLEATSVVAPLSY